MTDEEIIAVVTAHKEGKTIQWKGDCSDDWEDCKGVPCWDFNHLYYRIKPEPHYRPFKSAEEVMEAIKEHGSWIKHKVFDETYYSVTSIDCNSVHTSYHAIPRLYQEMFDDYVWADDNTPFGKLEEE